MPIVLLVLATALVGVVADVVTETVQHHAEGIFAFGSVVAETELRGSIVILAVISAVAGAALAAAIAFDRSSRSKREMAAKLSETRDELSHHLASVEGRHTLLEWRVAELETQLDEAVAERDELRALLEPEPELEPQEEQVEALGPEDVVVVPEPEPVEVAGVDEGTPDGDGRVPATEERRRLGF